MRIERTEKVPVIAKTLRIHCKVRDEFTGHILDAQGEMLGGQDDGYVPGFMPGEHFGDYLMLDIDLDTGQITNWKVPPAEEIEEFIANEND